MKYFNEFTLIGKLKEENQFYIILEYKHEFINENNEFLSEMEQFRIIHYDQIPDNVREGNNIKVTGSMHFDYRFNCCKFFAKTIELYE